MERPIDYLDLETLAMATGCKLKIMEAPVARVSSPVRNSRHRDSANVQPQDSISGLLSSPGVDRILSLYALFPSPSREGPKA